MSIQASSNIATQLFCGDFLHVLENPFTHEDSIEAVEMGALAVSGTGQIIDQGPSALINQKYADSKKLDFKNSLILPGFIDLHTHFPQTFAAASSERELISWLNRHIFPAEARLKDSAVAHTAARFYVRKLLSSGTTMACIFGSQFIEANRELFIAAEALGLDIVTGMTLMDRFTPSELLMPFQSICANNEQLHELSQSFSRVEYACTPRFAISCTEALLEYCGDFAKRHQTFIQTHINESEDEVRWVNELFPDHVDYASVYEHYQLINQKTILAHSIYTRGNELKRFIEHDAQIAHCPSSNFFLGSGCFPMQRHLDLGVPFGVGTDIGAGTNFSMLNELGDAYKAQQILGKTLSIPELLYMGTLAGARALGRKDLGNFQVGRKADFVVFSWDKDAYLMERMKHCNSLEEIFFVLMFFSDHSHVKAVFKDGKQVFPFSESTQDLG